MAPSSPEYPDFIPDFDGSIESWMKIQQDYGVFSNFHYVVLLESDQNESLQSIVSCHKLAATLRKSEDELRYDNFYCLFPPGITADNARARAYDLVKESLEREEASELTRVVVLALLRLQCRTLISLSTERLLAEISELPPNTLCCVVGAERFRSNDPSATDTLHVERLNPADSHLSFLGQKLLLLAEERSITIIMCSESTPFNPFSFETIKEGSGNLLHLNKRRNEGRSIPNFDIILQAYEAGSWPKLIADGLAGDQENVGRVAIHLAGHYASLREYSLGWAVIEKCPNEVDPADREERILLAILAAEAGKHEIAIKNFSDLLEDDLLALEELGIAHQYCLRNEYHILADNITQRLLGTFPGHSVSLEAKFRRDMRRRDFTAALHVAKTLSDPILTEYASAFAAEILMPDRFLDLAQGEGTFEAALFACVEEAMIRQKFEQATELCRRIADEAEAFYDAYRRRLKILAACLHKDSSFYREEFLIVLTIAAQRPSDRRFRDTMLWLIEDALEEPSSILLLCAATMLLLGRSRQHISASLSTSAAFHAYLTQALSQAPSPEEMERALTTFLESIDGPQNLGEGDLPEESRRGIGLWTIPLICYSLDELKFGGNLETTKMLFHLLVLICKANHHPSADFFALSGFIGTRATLGDNQTCRDLAETGLVKWAIIQPEFSSWRTGLAWAAWGEASLRAGNALQGLLYVTFALAAHNGPAMDEEFLGNIYRLAARALRDCHAHPLAYIPVEMERSIIEQSGRSESLLHRNRVLHATLKVREVVAGASVAEMVAMLEELQTLLSRESESDVFPLISLQATILRQLPSAEVPADIAATFRDRLLSIPENLRHLLSGTAFREHSTEQVRDAIRRMPHARYADDLKFQIGTALPFFCNAIDQSEETQDAELFLVASGAISQPLLSAQENDQSFLSFAPLAEIGLADLIGCLGPEEGVLVISGEPAAPQRYIYVTAQGSTPPRILNGWTSEQRRGWREEYYSILDYEFSTNIILDPKFPSQNTVKTMMGDFQLPLGDLPKSLIVIPPSHLFGFTFQLILRDATFLEAIPKPVRH